MMSDRRLLATLFVCLTGLRSAFGQAPMNPPRYGAPYPEIKTWHEQMISLGAGDSAEARVVVLRRVLRTRYGDRGLNAIFKNLTATGEIDLRIPGVKQNLLLAASDNSSVAQGARRTQLYAVKLHHDPRFRVLAINQRTVTALGGTDKDIVYQDVRTGRRGWMEVKEISPATQRANLVYYKEQLSKIASTKGEIATWVNRQELIPELRDYGERLGIGMYGKVATGERSTLTPGNVSFTTVADECYWRHVACSRVMIEGGAALGFGALLVVQSAPAAWAEGSDLFDSQRRSLGAGLRFGQYLSYSASGVAMMIGSSAGIAESLSADSIIAGRFSAVSRWSGPVAVAAFVAAEGFAVSQYFTGNTTAREFARQTAGVAGGAVGAIGGAWAGAELGGIAGSVFGPVGTAIGAGVGVVAGGLGGGYAGSSIAGSGVATWNRLKDAGQQDALRNFIYARYGATP